VYVALKDKDKSCSKLFFKSHPQKYKKILKPSYPDPKSLGSGSKSKVGWQTSTTTKFTTIYLRMFIVYTQAI